MNPGTIASKSRSKIELSSVYRYAGADVGTRFGFVGGGGGANAVDGLPIVGNSESGSVHGQGYEPVQGHGYGYGAQGAIGYGGDRGVGAGWTGWDGHPTR